MTPLYLSGAEAAAYVCKKLDAMIDKSKTILFDPRQKFGEIHLFKDTNFGKKYWIAAAMEAEICLWWGRTGDKEQQRHIPKKNCAGSTLLELRKRTLQNIDEGYELNLKSSRFEDI